MAHTIYIVQQSITVAMKKSNENRQHLLHYHLSLFLPFLRSHRSLLIATINDSTKLSTMPSTTYPIIASFSNHMHQTPNEVQCHGERNIPNDTGVSTTLVLPPNRADDPSSDCSLQYVLTKTERARIGKWIIHDATLKSLKRII